MARFGSSYGSCRWNRFFGVFLLSRSLSLGMDVVAGGSSLALGGDPDFAELGSVLGRGIDGNVGIPGVMKPDGVVGTRSSDTHNLFVFLFLK